MRPGLDGWGRKALQFGFFWFDMRRRLLIADLTTLLQRDLFT